jgi:hypothetical protein
MTIRYESSLWTQGTIKTSCQTAPSVGIYFICALSTRTCESVHSITFQRKIFQANTENSGKRGPSRRAATVRIWIVLLSTITVLLKSDIVGLLSIHATLTNLRGYSRAFMNVIYYTEFRANQPPSYTRTHSQKSTCSNSNTPSIEDQPPPRDYVIQELYTITNNPSILIIHRKWLIGSLHPKRSVSLLYLYESSLWTQERSRRLPNCHISRHLFLRSRQPCNANPSTHLPFNVKYSRPILKTLERKKTEAWPFSTSDYGASSYYYPLC